MSMPKGKQLKSITGILRKKPSFEVLLMLPAVTILLIITIYPTFICSI
jgi:hypothetical protein